MKKILVAMIHTLALIGVSVLGIVLIHFLFVMGVGLSAEQKINQQCIRYAEINQVKLVKTMNAFTYLGDREHVVCVVEDLYNKMVFLDSNLVKLAERNYRSYTLVEDYDRFDSKQGYKLSLYHGEPVYILKKVSKESLVISYYYFDGLKKILQLDSRE